jgi:MoaA/NifB/PqqE/SkfB family radical SAM enzyme
MSYSCQYKNGATITVLVPYDCDNNCPFCVNKADYRDKYLVKDINKVIEGMIKLDEITPNCDYVFSGGEPFANLDGLKQLLEVVRTLNKNGSNHKLFINTTFPTFKGNALSMINLCMLYKDVITGLNISRHLCKYVYECNDLVLEVLRKLGFSLRINSVVYRNSQLKYLPDHLERFKDYSIQIREDYTQCKIETLHDYYDKDSLLQKTLEAMNLEFDENSFLFRNDFRWNYILAQKDNGEKVTLHRTLPYSTIKTGDNEEINDIIIEPTGNVVTDWNDYGHLIDYDEYKHCMDEKKQEIKSK